MKIFEEKIDGRPGAKRQWLNVSEVVGRGRATLALGIYKKFWEFCDKKGVFNKLRKC